MVLAAGSEALGLPVQAITVNRLEVEQMLPLDSQTRVTTQLVRSADNSIRVEIHSRSAGGNWCRHAVARVEVPQQDAPPPSGRVRPVKPGLSYHLRTSTPPCDAPVHITGRRLPP